MSDRPNKPKNNEKINKVKLGVASDMDGVIRNTEQYLREFSASLESQLDAVEKENKALKEELQKQKDENEKMKANTQAVNKIFSQRLATTNEAHQAAIKLLEDELMACKLENEKLKSGNGAGNEKGTTMTAYGNIESNVEPFQKVSGENVEVGRPKFQMTFNSKAKLQTTEEPDNWLKTTSSTTSTALPSTTQETPRKEEERSHMSNSNIIRGRISWHEAISQSQKFAVNQATLRKMNLLSCFFDSNKKFQFLPQKVDELPRDSMEFAKVYGKDKSGNSVSEEARNMYHTLLEEQDRQIRLGMIKIKRD
ncbi:hypothetical protein CAEBREN_09242 [Caenorhabditis brenneri]|uniref:Uncharacterized protein n=1 Tax=Caenorhabditis brenneri TaxID=135651 RepID=G0N4C0_CAEBE|nr:hypothetical protein CAEBREN_09242 [Caenorhabditis brenneri]